MTLPSDRADRGARWGWIVIAFGIAIPIVLLMVGAIALIALFAGSARPITASDVEGTCMDDQSGVLVLNRDGSAEVRGLAGQSASGMPTVATGEGTGRLTSSDRVQVLIEYESDRLFVDVHAEWEREILRLVQFDGDPDDPDAARILEMSGHQN